MGAGDSHCQPTTEQPPEQRGTYTLIKVTDLAAMNARIEELEGALRNVMNASSDPYEVARAALSHRSAKT